MKKMILVLAASIGIASSLLFTSCGTKHFATTPPGMAANDTSFVPFTKSMMKKLEHDGVDIKKIQFYTSDKIVLKHAVGGEKGLVKSGVIMMDYGQAVNQITIPAWTPGVCEKVDGDQMMISFDAPGKDLEFGAMYENPMFILVGTNYHNNGVDITYDGQSYVAECETCGNVADVKLYVRKNQAYKSDDKSRVVMGRKVN